MVGIRRMLAMLALGGAAYGYYQHGASSDLASASRVSGSTGRFAQSAWNGAEGAAAITPVADFGQLFRLDIQPEWVMNTWPRVSTGLSELSLQGYRVPLVTGTEDRDLAGSLTYYFDARQRVKRIAFSGMSGDYRELVHLVQQRFGFHHIGGSSAAVMTYARGRREAASPFGGGAAGRLQVSPAPVVSKYDANGRYQIELVIEGT